MCYDEIPPNKEHSFKCSKAAVARCGETLTREFENALNAEKPLQIIDFEPKTVSALFNYVENRVIDISEITFELAILAHLYQVFPLFRICEKYLAETKTFSEFDIDNWINFAEEYHSTRLTQAILLWAEKNAKKYEKWEETVDRYEEFKKMVGSITLGLDKRYLLQYKIKEPKGIYLFPLE